MMNSKTIQHLELRERWYRLFGEYPPALAHLGRLALVDSWIQVHYLPDSSQRDPESALEIQQIWGTIELLLDLFFLPDEELWFLAYCGQDKGEGPGESEWFADMPGGAGKPWFQYENPESPKTHTEVLSFWLSHKRRNHSFKDLAGEILKATYFDNYGHPVAFAKDMGVFVHFYQGGANIYLMNHDPATNGRVEGTKPLGNWLI